MGKFNCEEMHKRQEGFVHCMWCKKKIGKSFKEKLKDQADAVPIETRQQILDLMHEGKSLGEVKAIVGLKTVVIGEIIVRNMDNVNFLRREAK